VNAPLARSWGDAVSEAPLATAVTVAVLAGGTVAVAFLLRWLTRRTRELRHLVVAIVLASLALAAVAAMALARLMVLDDAEARAVLDVLAVAAVLAVVLALVSTVPLARDARRLEVTVRRIEQGDRTVRSEVHRADELGSVAHALDELTERLDALEREREGFETERRHMLTSVGHDLRTPLTALRAAIEALTDGVAPDPDRYLSAMARDVEALGALVDDVFLLSSLEAGRLDLPRHAVDLTELADEAVEALAPMAAARSIHLELAASGRVTVDGNPIAIGRVIRNLVDNAVRHAPEGSSVRIVVSDDAAPERRARVEVVDDGPGFPAEFAPHAFERFARADPSRTRTTGGAGLGLAIARGLVEAHGGRIWIGAPPGGRVAFELPAA
jgi:two-component system sensor histidine kinase BaeS